MSESAEKALARVIAFCSGAKSIDNREVRILEIALDGTTMSAHEKRQAVQAVIQQKRDYLTARRAAREANP